MRVLRGSRLPVWKSQEHRCSGTATGTVSFCFNGLSNITNWATPPVRLGISGRNSGKIPERPRKRSQRFLEFPSRVRLGCPKPYNSRHLRLPERFQNSLPPSTAGDASFSRIGSGEGLSELVMEFPAALGVFLTKTLSREEPSEPKTGTTRTVPRRNRNRTTQGPPCEKKLFTESWEGEDVPCKGGGGDRSQIS